jgi:hypothetical protein
VERLEAFQRPATADTSFIPAAPDLERQLFDSLSRSARLTAMLSMHLPAEWRTHVLDQLRALLSFEAWDDDSNLLDEASTQTFLRFVIFAGVRRIPSLGISNRRLLMATWTWPGRKVFMEYGAKDRCRSVFSYPGEFEQVRQAVESNVGDAVRILASNGFDFADTTPLSTAS